MGGKKKLKKKEQNPHQMLTSQARNRNKDEILKKYERHNKLLKRRPAENMEEKEIEQMVHKIFQEIIAEGKADREIIAKSELRNAIKGMKNKKAGDKNNWKAEWIKEGGEKMVQSLVTLFNRVEEKNKIMI